MISKNIFKKLGLNKLDLLEKIPFKPFPQYSKLVFSTDTEINDDLHNMLKADVSKEYLIEYSGTTNSSTFNSGYFEKEKEYV